MSSTATISAGVPNSRGQLERVAAADLEAAVVREAAAERVRGRELLRRRRPWRRASHTGPCGRCAAGSTTEPPAEPGVRDGLAYALFLPRRGAAAGGVVILHGAGSQKENHFDFARACRAAGLAAVAFDQRGHGESDGALDGRAIDDVATMARRCCRTARRSRCAGRAWAAGSRSPRAPRWTRAAVVAICPASGAQLARGLADRRFAVPRRPGLARARCSTTTDLLRRRGGARRAGSCSCTPRATRTCPVEHSRALHAAAPGSRIEVVPGGDHRSVQHDPELQALAVRFLGAARGAAAAAAPSSPGPIMGGDRRARSTTASASATRRPAARTRASPRRSTPRSATR